MYPEIQCPKCSEVLLDSELELVFAKKEVREAKKKYFCGVLGGKVAVCQCGNVQAFEAGRVEESKSLSQALAVNMSQSRVRC